MDNLQPGLVIVYDHEIHVYQGHTLAVGDKLQVVRGNGPREGDPMGIATVVQVEDGEPTIVDVSLFLQ